MLYNPARHQKIKIKDFNEAVLHRVIKKIVDEVVDAGLKSNVLWPIHPKDRHEECPEFMTDFYMGAAGVVWALHHLSDDYNPKIKDFCKNKIDEVLAAHLELSEYYTDRGSYFVGEAGVRAVKEKAHPSLENHTVLKSLIHEKFDSTQNELLYGLPGTLLMAFLNKGLSNQIQIDEIIGRLLSTRVVDPDSAGKIWIQNFEEEFRYLGAAHGSVGNYGVLLRVLRRNETEQRFDVISNLEKILKTYAKIEDGFCNWPTTMDFSSDPKFLVHWCHGATGVITELATNVENGESEIISDLILKAGNLVWMAGALEKGTSLCHGTAGSGMAMLKLYLRTQDTMWLDRARAFAMYAIDQHEAEVSDAGQLRYSLWTGDLGLAIFLNDCIRASSSMPGLDLF